MVNEGVTAQREALQLDLARWQEQVSAVAGTHCEGIGKKAVGRFEALLKMAVATTADRLGVSFDDLAAAVHYNGAARTFDKLTLGTVVEMVSHLAKHDSALADKWSPIDAPVRAVVALRNPLIHAPNLERLVEDVSSLLDNISIAVSASEFWVEGDAR